MLEQNTHLLIDSVLVGKTVSLDTGKATAELMATPDMGADERGLVHGGFTFGLADFAAMLAVNDPNVVLGGAETQFLAPVQVGQRMVATAKIASNSGKKRTVQVEVKAADTIVMTGTFTCFVLPRHVLDR